MLGIPLIEAPGSDGLRPQPHMRSSYTPSLKTTVSRTRVGPKSQAAGGVRRVADIWRSRSG